MFSLKFNLSFVFVIVVFCYLNISFFLWVSLCSLHVVNTWVRIFWMCWPPLPMTAPAICKWKKTLSYAARREGGFKRGINWAEILTLLGISMRTVSSLRLLRFWSCGPSLSLLSRFIFIICFAAPLCVCVFVCVCVSVFLSAKEKHKSKHA